MLIKYKVSGYKVFFDEIDFTMKANKKIKNKDNVFTLENGEEILKSSVIYGPNNTGKSCFIESFKLLKEIISKEMIVFNDLNKHIDYNYFLEDSNKRIKYEIEFLSNSEIFKYYLEFKYDEIISEVLFVNNKEIFDRNKEKQKDETMTKVVKWMKEYKNKLIVGTLPSDFIYYSNAFKSFFDKMIIPDNDELSYFRMNKVFDFMSSNDKNIIAKFNKMIKAADISIEKIELENELDVDEKVKELKLISTYKLKDIKKSMPSALSDSSGSKRFMAYVAYILESLEKGGVLIVDEIDNSLHTLLTKNILSVINNKNNKKLQLICTTHDLLLLDTNYLFRKDQIWFTYKDSVDLYFYCLNDFKCNKDDGIRSNTMINYLKGMFGALPHPNIEEVLYEDKNNTEM